MNIRDKESLITEIELFKGEALKMYIGDIFADSYTNTNLFDYTILENENNKVWWMDQQAYRLWKFWKKAKDMAVPDGFKIVKKQKLQLGNPNVDFSLAPSWADYWVKDGYSNKCLWCGSPPKLNTEIGCFVLPFNYKAIEAPDFDFDGDWMKSITSRKSMIEAQELVNH
jgi:hypothetical protein